MNGEGLHEIGTDIDSSFNIVNGDLILVSDENNIVQAVANRLNTELNELDLFYENYGSVLSGFLGWKAEPKTLDFMQTEVDTVLLDESRLIEHSSVLSYMNDGSIRIELVLVTTSGLEIETNFVLGSDGVIEVETDDDDNEYEEE